MIEDQIVADLKKALKKLELPVEKVHLEHPEKPEHGDYATNVALVLAKRVKKKPMALARLIVKNFPKTDYLEKVEAAPPGFINFWLAKKWLIKQLSQELKLEKRKEKIMVEFAHPNTHKPFHIGHLRNIILGESICRLLEAVGSEVVRVNYQGDVGLHIAKCLWGTKKLGMKRPTSLDKKVEFLGQAYVKGNQAYEEDKKAKEAINELNRKIYEKDKEIMPLWQETRAWSLDYFDRIYKRVETKFDRLYFEGEVAETGKKIVLENLTKVFEKSKGAIIFDGEKYGLHKRVFINKLGFPTYEAKDMGLGRLQLVEYHPDLIVHVVGPEQQSYFQVVFKALELIMPETKGKEYHRVYGWVRLKKGKMASRLGKVVLGEWLLDEVKRRLLKKFKMKEVVAEVVAIGAVKYSMLKLEPLSEIAFDIDESISLEGNSGPYLQYTYARAKSVLRKAEVLPDRRFVTIPDRQKIEQEELAILRTIYKFPEVVLEAGESYAPNLICNFLFDLTQKFNLFYNQHRIIGSANEKFRLALTASLAQVIKNGLRLLGIKTLKRM